MKSVLFSILIVSLNAGKKIRNTILSAINQSLGDFEILIKDGGSSDDTLSFIPEDERITVIREKDRSVYEGMNQAIGQAHGRYLIFMNCGDCFAHNNVLKEIAEKIAADHLDGSEILYGDYKKNGKIGRQTKTVDRAYLLHKGGLCHQTAFFGRNVFERCGLYALDYPLCADYEFMTRAYFCKIPFVYVPTVVCIYEGGGMSEQPEVLGEIRNEGKRVRQKYFSLPENILYSVRRVTRRMSRAYGKHIEEDQETLEQPSGQETV